MTKFLPRSIPFISAMLLFVLLGGPQMAMAWQQQGVQTNTGTTAPPANPSGTTAALPDAPSTQQQQNDQQSAPQQKKSNTPLGAAAAEAGVTAGGAASRPAGAAIAPAKQGQRRSLLIKIGLIAAAGAAIGGVYALSRGTSSTPPGAVK